MNSDRDSREPSEVTALRGAIHNSQISYSVESSSSGATIEMADDRCKIFLKVGLDFLLLFCVGFPILAFFLWGNPFERGFFCDDESLMHPFSDSTVRSWMLYIIGMVVPVTAMIIIEFYHACRNKSNESERKLRFYNWDIPAWVVNSYKQIGVFGFGLACSQLTTDIAKYSIGRLRPHFLHVCQPIMPDGTNCTNPLNLGRYILDYECRGEGSNERMLKEMRLSFPSGHSSFSTFAMVYLAIYLHARLNWRGSKLMKHFLQFICIMLAWYTSLSRISDYKHHWSDVLAGATLGVFGALIITNFVSDLFTKKNRDKMQPIRYELGTSNNGQV